MQLIFYQPMFLLQHQEPLRIGLLSRYIGKRYCQLRDMMSLFPLQVGKRSSFSGNFTPFSAERARKSSRCGENSSITGKKLTIPLDLLCGYEPPSLTQSLPSSIESHLHTSNRHSVLFLHISMYILRYCSIQQERTSLYRNSILPLRTHVHVSPLEASELRMRRVTGRR